MASTFDANALRFKVAVDAKLVLSVLPLLIEVRRELEAQLTLSPLRTCGFSHLIPTTETGVASDEARESSADNILAILDAACIKECLQRLEVSVLSYESIRH